VSRLADRRQRRRRRAWFWGIVAVLVAYTVFAGDYRPHHLLVLWLEEGRVESRIAELRAENEALEARRTRLDSDPFRLEELAREKGMMRPGDIVYRIVPVPAGVREAAAESIAARSAAAAAESLLVGADRGGHGEGAERVDDVRTDP